MEILNTNKIKLTIVENNHPVLYNTLMEKFSHLSKEDKEKISGLVIDSVLSSGGNLNIFDESDDIDFDDNESDY